MKLRTALIITLASVLGAGTASAQQQGTSPKPASKATKAANLAMQQYLNFNGFIGKPDTLTIKNAQGLPVWDLESYKAYICLDKPAVRDANDTMIKKQLQCKIWQAGNERRILKRSYLCEHV
jgi:alkyl sulfatase BDS1-like metallo-beta-lactamase superfamily hydrolase